MSVTYNSGIIVPLSEYVKENGQQKASELVDISQGCISRALSANRQIYLYFDKGEFQFSGEFRFLSAKALETPGKYVVGLAVAEVDE